MNNKFPVAQDIIELSSDMPITLLGDMYREIRSVKSLDNACHGALLFVNEKIAPEEILNNNYKGTTIICSRNEIKVCNDRTILIVDNPRLLFARVINKYFKISKPPKGIHPTANIDPTAIISTSASIGPFCSVGENSVIGADVILFPNVTVYSNVSIGERSIINSGSVIGADGFGYERNNIGAFEKFPQIGGVRIGMDVEIGSNTSIDRGALKDTVIEDGVKIDNQCHISHNVLIGADTAVIAQSMIGGSVIIGARSWLAPASVVMNQVHIGAEATIGMSAVVTKDVSKKGTVTGSPAVPIEEFRSMRQALKKVLDKYK